MNASRAVGPRKRHVIITGAGRSGTSLLVKLLTRMDLETGFTDAQRPPARTCLGIEC